MGRVLKALLKAKFVVYQMTENVASMSNVGRDVFFATLGLRPLGACPSGLIAVRRPRFYWIERMIHSSPGVSVENQEGYCNVVFSAPDVADRVWVDAGCEGVGKAGTRLPICVRAIARTKQTFMPAGLLTIPKAARARWRRDSWRYTPYH